MFEIRQVGGVAILPDDANTKALPDEDERCRKLDADGESVRGIVQVYRFNHLFIRLLIAVGWRPFQAVSHNVLRVTAVFWSRFLKIQFSTSDKMISRYLDHPWITEPQGQVPRPRSSSGERTQPDVDPLRSPENADHLVIRHKKSLSGLIRLKPRL